MGQWWPESIVHLWQIVGKVVGEFTRILAMSGAWYLTNGKWKIQVSAVELIGPVVARVNCPFVRGRWLENSPEWWVLVGEKLQVATKWV
jgi:hypothetical protein